jgi:endonuclease/exonuclease/phosphatase family metal-dependent hydrolase
VNSSRTSLRGRHAIARHVVRIAAHLAAALCLLTITAWIVGRILSDRFAWSQWLLWIPTPITLAAALLGLLLALRPASRPGLRRRRLIGWLTVFLLLAGHFALIEHRFLRTVPAEPDGFVIAHWTPAVDLTGRDAEFVDHLRELDADVTIVTNAAGAIWSPGVREWLGEGHRPIQMRPFAVLTRLPVLEATRLVSSDGINIALVEIDTGDALGGAVTIHLVDLPSGPRLPRSDVASRVRNLLASMDSPPPAPDLVVGDFNMTRDSAALRRITGGMTDAFRQGGHGYGATYYRAFPLYHIDHIMLADHLRCVRYDIIDPGQGRHRSQRAWIVPRASNPRRQTEGDEGR